MRARHAWLPVLCLALAAGAPGVVADDEVDPDAEVLLKGLDDLLFFPDSQEGLAGYECDVRVSTSSVMAEGGWVADRRTAKPLAHARLDVAKATKTWTDAGGKSIPPGTWAPFCGPWTLTDVMRFELELFCSPLSRRFAEAEWDRVVDGDEYGWILDLTPKKPPKGEPLRPVVTNVRLFLSEQRLPVRGMLALDQGEMGVENGTFELVFAEHGKRQRIERIENSITSANLRIQPALSFAWKQEGEFTLVERIDFGVPTGDLSPTMGRMMGGSTPTSLFFENYVVRKAGAPPAKAADAPAKPGAK